MLRRFSALAASCLVLFPIGGGSYVAQAQGLSATVKACSNSFVAVVGWLPEPAALALVFAGLVALAARRVSACARKEDNGR